MVKKTASRVLAVKPDFDPTAREEFSPRPRALNVIERQSVLDKSGTDFHDSFFTQRSKSVMASPLGLTQRDYFESKKKSVKPFLFATNNANKAFRGIENPRATFSKARKSALDSPFDLPTIPQSTRGTHLQVPFN